MKKRMAALLLALWMLAGVGAAEETASAPIATYALPQGAETLPLWDSGVWAVPDGLEEMYRIMQTASASGDVYLVRMPHGRALASISCMRPETPRTAQELLALWPQIAQAIARQGVAVNADEQCARVAQAYGFEALVIETAIGLGELGQGLQLDARGYAFARGEEMLEVWAVAPAEGSYADETAAAELQADRASLDAFLSSLSFTGLEEMPVEGAPYEDYQGRFSLWLPADCTVITRSTAQADIDLARSAYLEAHGDGAEAFFDAYLRDVREENGVLAIAGDQQLAAVFFAQQAEHFRDVTPEQLSTLAQPIRQTLAQTFEAALLLTDSQHTVISGARHSWLGYWLRNGQVNAQLDVLAAVLDGAWLYEVDFYTHNNDQQSRALWLMLVNRTMRYTPPANALAE